MADDPNAPAPSPDAPVATQPIQTDTQPPLPSSYDKISAARQQGFSWDEINQAFDAKRTEAKAAGFSDDEVDAALGLPANYRQQSAEQYKPFQMPSNTEAAANLRGWAEKYLTPSARASESNLFSPLPSSVGQFFKDQGTDVLDIGKMFGGAVVNGAAAILELSDGRPRSDEEVARLNAEATNFTMLGAGGLKAGSAKTIERPNVYGLPIVKDVLDAATSVKNAEPPVAEGAVRFYHGADVGNDPTSGGSRWLTPDQNYAANFRGNKDVHYVDIPKGSPTEIGARAWDSIDESAETNMVGHYHNIEAPEDIAKQLKPLPSGDLTQTAANLGQHFIETGEHPLDAAARAQQDPALMAKLRSGSPRVTTENPITGEVDPAPLTTETITQPNPDLSARLVDNFKEIFDPASRTDESALTADIVREGLARQFQRTAQSAERLRQFGRAVANLSDGEKLDFIHAYETGKTGQFAGTPLGDLATEIKSQLDGRYRMMEERGIEPGYIEDYLPHLYANPDEATAKLKNFYGTKSAGGNKSFTMERLFSTYMDAADELGLQPLTTNPVEMVMTHLANVDKYIAKEDIVRQLKDNELVKMKPHDLTREEEREYSDMKAVNPSIVRGANGTVVAPEEVATILNRWLQPGWNGKPIYDVIRSAGNMLNSAQLGMSGFHAGFVTAEMGASTVAKGIKQISRLSPEEIVRGVGNVALPEVGQLKNMLMGRKVIQQMLGKANYGPEIQTIADAYVSGGGRVGLDPMYKTSAYNSFLENMKGSILAAKDRIWNQEGTGPMTLPQALKEMYAEAEPIKWKGMTVIPSAVRATALLVPRIMETLNAPLMEKAVPIMKAGVFADLMRDELRRNPNMSPEEVRAKAGVIQRSVDNRLGQMVYDNRFWDKQLRDIGHVAIRSLGWTAGTLDELAGGSLDLAKGVNQLRKGEMQQLTDRASYVVAMPIYTMRMGAMFGALYGTWKASWGIWDYLFPPTGGKDAQGGEERASMLGYMKDAVEWTTNPLGTAASKTHPLWPFVYNMMTNRQWNGAVITDPRDSLSENTSDYTDYVAEQFLPIAIKGQPGQEDSNLSDAARFFGLRPAPFAIREPGMKEGIDNSQLQRAIDKKHLMDNRK